MEMSVIPFSFLSLIFVDTFQKFFHDDFAFYDWDHIPESMENYFFNDMAFTQQTSHISRLLN